jgi:NAD dependent epimerase/dehydratase family enzyme
MKAVLSEFAWELLGSNRALPTRLQSTAFTFHHPTVQSAISAALTH